MIRIITAAAIVAMSANAAMAQYYGYGSGSNSQGHSSSGYTNSRTGEYVQPHYQSNPNSTQMDNYSTRGNTNPYTGAQGTRTPKW